MKFYHTHSISFILIIFFIPAFFAQINIFPRGGNHYGLSEVTIDLPADTKAYFTKDGSLPTKRSEVVPSSISVQDNVVLRFLFVDNEGKKSLQTHSYIVSKKHDLPIVSIVGDPAYFFDSLEGMFEMGCCADTVSPYFGANFWKKKESAVNFEFFENLSSEKQAAINQIVGVKTFGGFSKAMPQKSLAIHARKKYGSNKLKHAFFPNLPFKKYKSLVLRNGGNDMEGSHLRDVLASQIISGTGLLFQEYRPVVVYINGKYWGKYNLREKINEHFVSAHTGYHKDSLIIMRHNADHQHGSPKSYRKFISKLPKLDLTRSEDVDYVASKIDIRNYFLYNIAQIYTANGDAGGNIRYYKHVNDTSKWRWIFYDLDATFNINGKDNVLKNSVVDFTTLKEEAWPNPPWSTLIIRKLLENDSLRYLYINDFTYYLATVFDSEIANEVFESITTQLDTEIDDHLKRWGVSRKKYNQHLKYIASFIYDRPGVLLSHLQSRFDLPAKTQLSVNYEQEFGKVYLNGKEVDNGFSATFFQGIPVHYIAVPYYDYEFVGWKNANEINPELYQMITTEKFTISPVFRQKRKSPYAYKVRITEIDSYQEKCNHGDWVEIYNRTDQPIDVSNWVLKDDDDNHSFLFPQNKIIPPKGFLVLVQNETAFRAFFKREDLDIVGSFGFGLAANNDKIRLYDAEERKVDEVNLSHILDKDTSDTLALGLKNLHLLNSSTDNWLIENVSLGQKGNYAKHYELEKFNKRKKVLLFFYGLLVLSILLILFFSVSLWRKKRNSNEQV